MGYWLRTGYSGLKYRLGHSVASHAGKLVATLQTGAGLFVPLIEALTERQWGDNLPRSSGGKSLALLATPAPVASRAFQRELAIGVDVEV